MDPLDLLALIRAVRSRNRDWCLWDAMKPEGR